MTATAPAPLAGSIGGVSNLLAELQTDTASRIEAMTAEVKTSATDLEARLADMQTQLEAATEIRDPVKRADRVRILTSTLEQLREQDQKETLNVAEAVMNIAAITQTIGGEFSSLSEPSSDEKSMEVEAQRNVDSAKANVEKAKKLWRIFGIRGRALKLVNTQLEAALEAQKETQAAIRKMARERLQSASMETSMQTLRAMVYKVITLAEAGHKTTANQLRIVTARKNESYKTKQQAAEIFEKLEAELAGIELDLGAAMDQQKFNVNGTPEYVTQEQVISELKRRAEEVRGKKEVAKNILLSKEKFTMELETHETATRKIYDNQSVWIAKLKSDSEEREVTWKNRLETMKAMDNLDVMSNMDQVSSVIDLQGAEYMATASGVADRQRQAMNERHPLDLAVLDGIRAASAENDAIVYQRDAELVAQFRKRWGLDPLAGSYLSHHPAPGTTPESAATAS